MSRVTRSMLAAQLAARHPQAEEYFRNSLYSVFRQWTTLELAVNYQWGGPNSAEKASRLVDDVYGMFGGPNTIYKDDVSIFLEDVLDNSFNTECEDGSPDEIGELLCELWRTCGEGDFTLANRIIERGQSRQGAHTISQGYDNGDAADSDGEDEAMGIEDLSEEQIQSASSNSMVVEEDEEEMPDPDGWQTVRRGRRKK